MSSWSPSSMSSSSSWSIDVFSYLSLSLNCNKSQKLASALSHLRQCLNRNPFLLPRVVESVLVNLHLPPSTSKVPPKYLISLTDLSRNFFQPNNCLDHLSPTYWDFLVGGKTNVCARCCLQPSSNCLYILALIYLTLFDWWKNIYKYYQQTCYNVAM